MLKLCVELIMKYNLPSVLVFFIIIENIKAALFPYESESRETKSLNGLWNFKLSDSSNQEEGFISEWFKHNFREIGDYIQMPVPASYNDITTSAAVRDYLGWVWYQRTFYAPKHWLQDLRVFVHFGGVHYNCSVWLNGEYLGTHEGGHMPFVLEATKAISATNTLTVAVNNILTSVTIPQGRLVYPNDTQRYPVNYSLYTHDFDYFDYAGINRPVTLYTTPESYISDVIVTTDVMKYTGVLSFEVIPVTDEKDIACRVSVKDRSGNVISKSRDCSGSLLIHDAKLWWPSGSCHPPGYLYTLEIQLNSNFAFDVYRLPVGIRTLKWTSTALLINDEPVYLRGFGMHEDSDIRGRGFDYSVLVRDIHLIKWIGANSFRTSHYPYAEETLNEADANGFLVILESPACSLKDFSSKLLENHKRVTSEIVAQYRNHPSVIMWSLANEPVTSDNSSDHYFGNLSSLVRSLDKTRPVTFVTSQHVNTDKAMKHMDIICVNRYSSWYSDPGHLDLITMQTVNELTEWHSNFSKPVIMTEYGAGSVSGLHSLPASMWSEDYQVWALIEHFKAFDILYKKGFLIGEMIWNFADFNTPQGYTRPGKNCKGVFTRSRQPKAAAHVLRSHYHQLLCEPAENTYPQVIIV